MAANSKFSKRSRACLVGVHPDLVKVMEGALVISSIDFGISEGPRTLLRQQQLYDAGASKTMNSRHIPAANGLAHAVDVFAVVGGQARWDWPLYEQIAGAVKASAATFGVAVEWGGDWATFKDGPHFQLSWQKYPGDKPI